MSGRAVYLLIEIFEYSFKEISGFLEKSEEACRKIAQRARTAVLAAPRFVPKSPDSAHVIAQFFESAKNGDQASLIKLLSDGSEFWSDGGGKVAAAKTVLTEKAKIAAFFAALGNSKAFVSGDFKLEFTGVSSRPGLIISKRLPTGLWTFETILSFEIAGERIARIYCSAKSGQTQGIARRKHARKQGQVSTSVIVHREAHHARIVVIVSPRSCEPLHPDEFHRHRR